MEIRAGAGGEEAANFAADLFRMYTRYAQSKDWKFLVIDSSRSSLGGFKEISLEISDPSAFEELKNESGVHRVQRIPATEKNGRIHTSTASVAILPKVEAAEIKINPQDLRIETARSSGPGGQNVNKRSTAVRVTHVPTNIVVFSQTERSQPQNKEIAMEILRAKLYEIKREREMNQLSQERQSQIGTADRSEKIRTYNYPQNRVTDHRINKSWHDLETIMNGKLDAIVKTFRKTET
ncbi:MAG: Peptide chain release factor 1 [Parcubacteria group bacterium GW2011_GWA1_42_7]|nr:MAG: Peptide chain release factor 1 [Parcubacteria group bacterium GW2011_GWB1_42_6]KKS70106.1 MAG: Peptide chain release factor 1 [Parcubacteria group bacterium GW2011_GWA1_42_7]KKS92480.1 MAG: Peptide chain release factor 1 [Parcubacteria group bacterium GW2011_GWC1_43_12]